MNPKFMKGAAAEYVAASWFLRAGYEVWWPAVQQSRVDFMITKNGRSKKVQVKSARKITKDAASYVFVTLTQGKGNRLYKRTELDVMVVVYKNALWVIPFPKLLGKQGISVIKLRGRNDWRRKFNADRYRVQ